MLAHNLITDFVDQKCFLSIFFLTSPFSSKLLFISASSSLLILNVLSSDFSGLNMSEKHHVFKKKTKHLIFLLLGTRIPSFMTPEVLHILQDYCKQIQYCKTFSNPNP